MQLTARNDTVKFSASVSTANDVFPSAGGAVCSGGAKGI